MPTPLDPETAPCPGECGEDVEYRPLKLGPGREIGAPPLCPDCTERREREEREQIRREEAEREIEARREREENIHRLLHEAGANPWAHGDATLGSWDAEAGALPLEATKGFLSEIRQADTYEPVRGLYLFGPTGTGKTMLATALIRELLIDGWSPCSVAMDHAAALITEIQDCYGSDRSVLAVKERRAQARLWVLDDLGTERPSDDVVRILTEILNQREGRPTMITSNLAPQKLEGRHPELGRVVSRLGPRYFRVVKVEGRDRRFDAA